MDLINNKINVDVFVGRFQPVHIGHISIVNKLDNPFVILVKGKKSSKNKDRNPFPKEFQLKMMNIVFPKKTIIIVATSGYLPDIFIGIRGMGFEPRSINSGRNRIKDYKRQINDFNIKNPVDEFKINYHITKRTIQGEDIRISLVNNDIDKFKKLMPIKLRGMFEEMRGYFHNG